MAKDPAFLFYSSDFITGTLTMTDEQVGKYIRLMCLQHQKGPLKEKDMLYICKQYDEDIFSKFEKDENGFFTNKRLFNETEKRSKHSKKQSENIKKRYQTNTTNLPNCYQNYSNELPLENVIVNENTIEKEIIIELGYKGPAFLKMWETFLEYRAEIKKPIKSKHTILNQLRKLAKYETNIAIEMIKQTIDNGWQGIFELKQQNGTGTKQTATDQRRASVTSLADEATRILSDPANYKLKTGH